MVTLLILFMLLVLVAKIPKKMVQENIVESQEAFWNNRKISQKVNKVDKVLLHAYGDAMMLNVIYLIDPENPIESVIEAKFYSVMEDDVLSNDIQELVEDNAEGKLEGNMQYIRYWHGYITILRPLLAFLNLQQIYVLNACVLAILTVSLIIILIKKKQIALTVSFIIGLVMCSAFMVPLCLEYTSTFLIMLIVSIIAVLIEKNDKNDKKLNILFFITGMLTCYLDFLTTEIITIFIPVIMVLIIRYKDKRITNLKQGLKFVCKACFLWLISYVGMWLAKWILASIILKINAFEYVVDYAMKRVNGEENGITKQVLLLNAIPKNLFALYPFNMQKDKLKLIIVPIVLLITEIIIIRKKDIKKLWISLLLILIAVIPYARYLLLSNHSYWHYFFTFRIQIITIMGLILAMIYSCDWNIIKTKFEKKRKKKDGVNNINTCTK